MRVGNSRSSNNPKTLLEQKEEGRAGSIARLNYTKRWMLALHTYAEEHEDRFPTTFDQATRYWPGDEAKEEIHLMPEDFEIVYQGSLDTLTNAQNIIVIRERQARQYFDGNWAKAYVFADGHSEIHSAPTGDFESFEKKHFIPPPNP